MFRIALSPLHFLLVVFAVAWLFLLTGCIDGVATEGAGGGAQRTAPVED